jgi:hypothetical protein
MHLEADIVELRSTLGACDGARMERYMEVLDLEAVDWEGDATAAETLFIG